MVCSIDEESFNKKPEEYYWYKEVDAINTDMSEYPDEAV